MSGRQRSHGIRIEELVPSMDLAILKDLTSFDAARQNR